MGTNTPSPSPNTTNAVQELSDWRLENSDSKMDEQKYLEGLDQFAKDFNEAFASVIEHI